MPALSELQRDALTEIFNISIGRAAAAMGKIVHNEITLMVPCLEFLNLRDATEHLGLLGNLRVSSVAQRFSGLFSTEAILMFPEDKTLDIVHMMLGANSRLSALPGFEQEAMSEIGNILLNACIGTIANISGSTFSASLPVFRVGNSRQILRSNTPRDDDMVLVIHIEFVITRNSIQGYLVFLMNLPSIDGLLETVERFLARSAV